jgi:hypothetical protein
MFHGPALIRKIYLVEPVAVELGKINCIEERLLVLR